MGAPPPVRAGGLGFVAVLAPGCILAGRERSLAGIGDAMLAAQAALHTVFAAARYRTAALPGCTMLIAHLIHGPITPRATVPHLPVALAAAGSNARIGIGVLFVLVGLGLLTA
ncbi:MULTISPECIES: hypothetical protein [Streptomyces]|uniref:hypothetical protein n=1 Tax=Streptomyces TaxID=1883 RepID=UPI0022AEBD53|nr:hypothetical protein [Streptomyces sp. H39-C1]